VCARVGVGWGCSGVMWMSRVGLGCKCRVAVVCVCVCMRACTHMQGERYEHSHL
jgi:hypothetical protein